MQNAIHKDSWIPLGQTLSLVAVILGCTWGLGAKFASIETKVEIIPKLERKVDALSDSMAKQDTKVQLINQRMESFQKPLENTQANARIIIRKVNQLHPASTTVGVSTHGLYELVN